MIRIPSPTDAREDVRTEERTSVTIPLGLRDDGRQRQRTGEAAINPYDIDDIKRVYAPTNGRGTIEQINREIDFEWKAFETYGKQNFTQIRSHNEQGWRAVQHSDFPERFAPAGAEGAVRVNDMILMHRPMRLTVQARQEEYARATRAMEVNRRKMAEAPEGQAPRMAPVIKTSRETIDIPE